MARYDHLEPVRLPEQFEHRKHGGGGPPPARNRDQHSTKLRDELDAATQAQRGRRKPESVDPSLILRVQMMGALLEEDWERLGLTLLSSGADRTLGDDLVLVARDRGRRRRQQASAGAGGSGDRECRNDSGGHAGKNRHPTGSAASCALSRSPRPNYGRSASPSRETASFSSRSASMPPSLCKKRRTERLQR
ncbi:hypothetical protein ACVWW4_003829 [Bradyrhizobium sp. LB7.1]